MKTIVLRIVLALFFGALLLNGALGLLLGWPDGTPLVQAQPATGIARSTGAGQIRVAPSGTDTPGCGADTAPCQSIQYAINQANDGDEIWIAAFDVTVVGFSTATDTARYTGNGDNVIELTRSLTLRGGYVYYHTTSPPVNQWYEGFVPAMVDGEHARRPLYISGDISPTLRLLAFVNGQADYGGNIYVEDARPKLLGTPIMSGNATYGGGLYLKNSRLSFDPGNVEASDLLDISALLPVQGNKATYGGGLYIDGGAPVLSLLYVYSNTASTEGGGLYLKGGRPIIAGGLVKDNLAGNKGGGFYLNESAARVAAVAVYSNTASDGAGFYLNGPFAFSQETVPIIANNYIRYNRTTSSKGGGLYFYKAIAGLVNNVIADNAASDGAAMYLYASSPQVFHNTIAQNAGSSGVYLTHTPGQLWPPIAPIPSYPSFTNTIIVSHSVGLYADSTGLSAPLQNKAALEGTLWWANAKDTDGSGAIVHSSDVYSNPQFICAGDVQDNCLRPYHLLTDSAAVDAGVEIALSLPGGDQFVDIDGQLRPSGEGYDIGADEVVSDAFSVWLVPGFSAMGAAPGETVTHEHQLLNTGLQTDTYTMGSHSSAGWSTLLSDPSITLGPQTSQTVQLRVKIPLTVTNQQSDTSVISAASTAEPARRALAVDATTAITGDMADLSLAVATDKQSLIPGEAAQYTFTISNEGPYSNTLPVTLTASIAPTRAIGGWNLPAGCAGAAATGYVACNLDLAAGTPPSTKNLSLLLTTSNAYSGWLLNSASVAGAVADPDFDNNSDQNTAQVTEDDYDPNQLSYGLYWFGVNNVRQKYAPGQTNPYFDASKPTVIFVHGWQPGLSGLYPPNFNYPDGDNVNTANAWLNDGWNIGVFYWNQFSDEPDDVKWAEAKIWVNDGPQKMRWRKGGAGYEEAPAGTPSAGELFYTTYISAMTEAPYSGGNIRLVGHSLGNQMASRLTKLVSDGIDAGTTPANLLPDRVALMDPYWSPGAKDYLGNKTTGQEIRDYVAELTSKGVLFEWYRSSKLTVEPEGDSNEALQPMMMYADMKPYFVSDEMSRHRAAWNIYFWSYAFDGPAACSGEGCLSMDRLLAKMSDQQLAAIERSDYIWGQSAGMDTATPEDDRYQSQLRSGAPYTVTQLGVASVARGTEQVIALSASVVDASGPITSRVLVSFSSDFGDITARSVVSNSAAMAYISADTSGTAHVSATTRGAEGAAQGATKVAFTTASTDCLKPLTGVDINGPLDEQGSLQYGSLYIGRLYTFTAVITPSNAATVTYTWSPEPLRGQGEEKAVYQWTSPNVYTLTLRAKNCGETFTAARAVNISSSPSNVPLTGVDITDDKTGALNTAYTFSANARPLTATLPITYTWQAFEQTSVSRAVSRYEDTQPFTWTVSGVKAVTLTAIGAAGDAVSKVYTISIKSEYRSIYLPIVLKN